MKPAKFASRFCVIPIVVLTSSLTAIHNNPPLVADDIEWHVESNGYRYYTVAGDAAGVRVYTLENGLTVYLARNTDEPRIRSMFSVRAGAAYDPPEFSGLAHCLEHLLFNGTDKIGALDREREQPLLEKIQSLYGQLETAQTAEAQKSIYAKIDELSVQAANYAAPGEYRKLASTFGAVAINGYTNKDITGYWCLMPSNALEQHLKLESERFRNPVFRNFQAELEAIFEEFNGLQDRPERRKRQALDALLFPNHSYGKTLIGTVDHLRRPSIGALRSFFEKWYVPSNLAVVLVGDLEFDRTIELVDQYLGDLPARPVEHPVRRADPLTAPVSATLYGPGEESVYFGFRMEGAGSDDEYLAMLTDMILNNGFAGLFDTELNSAQAVKRAGCTTRVYNDYSQHVFDGYPKEGQSLEEVKHLMLEQIGRIKRGEFDEWLMTGVINDLKKQFDFEHSTSVNLSAECMHSFKRHETWADRLAFIDRLGKITKQQLVDFANRTYHANHATVFMRRGEADVVRVDKPQFTPRPMNANAASPFAKSFAESEIAAGQPRFIDYEQAVASADTKHGIRVDFVENSTSEVFELDVIFDMGKHHDRKLPIVAELANRLGTGQHDFEAFKRQLYERGLTLSSYSTDDSTVFHLEGLQENLETGITLLDEFMAGAVVDNKTCQTYVSELLKQRESDLANSDKILTRGLLAYALYGEDSLQRSVLSAQELRALDPEELTRMIRELRSYRHRIFYFGQSHEQVVSLLNDHYRANPAKVPDEPKRYPMRSGQSQVYFVDLDIVQANVLVVSPGKKFDVANMGLSNFYSPYVDHIVFRELRGARSLAYSATAAHLMSAREDGTDFAYIRAKTQADKLPEALSAMHEIMNRLPGTADDVSFVQSDQLKRYQAERVNGKAIFWNRERLHKRGIRHDIREEQYETVQSINRDQLEKFFAENIGEQPKYTLVVGPRQHISMDALKSIGNVTELDARYLLNY